MRALRKTIAVAICAGFLAVPIGSLFIDWRVADGRWAIAGRVLFVLGALISLQNCYWKFMRPAIHVMHGRSLSEIRFISSYPLLGMLTVPGLALAPASVFLSIACLVLVAVDTGNLPWAVPAVWSDADFWDGDSRDRT
jgi:hypothetical protein